MMDFVEYTSGRWADYFLRCGEDFSSFWGNYLDEKRDIMFVLGLGFDPRMCSVIREILSYNGQGKRDCQVIAFNEGPDSPSITHIGRVQQNEQDLITLLKGQGTLKKHELVMWSDDGRRIGTIKAGSIFKEPEELIPYTDIIVDVSALPTSIYFPLIGKILTLIDINRRIEKMPNLHLVGAENPALDRIIRAEGIDDDADFLHGFSNGLEMEATGNIPRVWIPILGEEHEGELERIDDLVKPQEICPILPFPCSNPRRGDDIILQYRRLLFDRFKVEPGNIIYASENNPFEVYQKLIETIYHFNESLLPIGGCKAVISTHSSKLLSLGALITAYELGVKNKNVGVAHVEAMGYSIDEGAYTEAVKPENEVLFEMWVTGEVYANE